MMDFKTLSLVGMFMLCCSLAGAQSNRFTSNLELELVFHDPYMEKEFLIKEGGAVFETFDYSAHFSKKIGDAPSHIYLIEFKPESEPRIIFIRPDSSWLTAARGDKLRAPILENWKFTGPYGVQALLMIYSNVPLLFNNAEVTNNGRVIYPMDLEWLKNGEIPPSLEDAIDVQRVILDIRSETDYFFTSSSSGSDNLNGDGSGGDTSSENGFGTDGGGGNARGKKTKTTEYGLLRRFFTGVGQLFKRDRDQSPEESEGTSEDWSWGSEAPDSPAPDGQQEAVSLDLPRTEVPNNRMFVDYPLLIMNSPPEPAYSERGGLSKATPVTTKAYVVKGNVAAADMEDLSVVIEVYKDDWITEDHHLTSDMMRSTAQSKTFECQVALTQGENQIKVRAYTADGYSVYDDFNVSFTPDTTPAPGGRDFIIILGVNQYHYWPKLSNAVSDAQRIGKVLQNNYGTDSTKVFAMYDHQCTRVAVDSLFRLIISQTKETDRVLVYYAGHGYYDELLEEGYWVLCDGQVDKPGTYLSNSTLTKYIKSFRSKHTLFIADACFSGSYYTSTGRGLETRSDRLNQDRSRWMFSSGGLETVADDFQRSGTSPFAYYLLKYLENPPSSTFGIGELSEQIAKNVSSNSAQLPVARPLQNAGDEGGEYVFRKTK
ncbi:MAG: caspase family protein [Flavobacteriales bacterium]|nr:caspase family protein [Bacteroidota bacterium]MCB9239568.1 caspase family protein [Flavobacteriales bacterium]